MKLTADFETTTDPNDCRVWAYGLFEIGSKDNFIYGNNIDDFMNFISDKNFTLYFHNLKFDGEFILNWLFRNGFSHVKTKTPLEGKTFTTLISDKGQFYSIEICFGYSKNLKERLYCKIYDSLKILPFSVDKIAKAFGLPISKLELNYTEKRELGHLLTPEEIAYLKNDVKIVAMALDTLFKEGLNKMTQGSNALADYKKITGSKLFEKWFPVPYYDSEIRSSYKGGFHLPEPAT